MKCIECDEELTAADGSTTKTLLGYCSQPGHDHDDNCCKRSYWCKNAHIQLISKRNRCPNPNCDWVGKDECFCHPGKKVDEWPKVEIIKPVWVLKKEKKNG